MASPAPKSIPMPAPAPASRPADSRSSTEDAARIKELQQRELVLRESHARYRNLFDRTPAALMCIDAGLRLRSVNRNAVQLLGYTAPELLDKPIFDLFVEGATGKNRAREMFLWLQRMSDAEIHEEELELHTPDGRKLWLILAVRAARDANGQIIEYSAAMCDVSRAHQAEYGLHESDERYRRFFLANATPMVTCNPNGHIVECNDALASLIGCESRRDAVHQNLWRFIEGDAQNVLVIPLEKSACLRGHLLRFKSASGKTIDVAVNAMLRTEAQTLERFIEATLMEIPANVSATQALQAENARYRDLLAGIARQLGGMASQPPPVAAPSARTTDTTKRAAPASFATPAAVPGTLKLATGSPLILLAERDAAVRSVMRSILQADGYSVLEAPTGSAAVAVSAAQDHAIALLITGATMPDMSGHELARCIAHLHARAKVVFLAENRKDSCLTSDGFVLGREFTPADLSRTVRQMLSA